MHREIDSVKLPKTTELVPLESRPAAASDTTPEHPLVKEGKKLLYLYRSYHLLQETCLDPDLYLRKARKAAQEETCEQLRTKAWVPKAMRDPDWTFQTKALVEHLGEEGRMLDIFRLPVYEYLKKFETLLKEKMGVPEAEKEVMEVRKTVEWLNNTLRDKCTADPQGCFAQDFARHVSTIWEGAKNELKRLGTERGRIHATSPESQSKEDQLAGEYLDIFNEASIQILRDYAQEKEEEALKLAKDIDKIERIHEDSEVDSEEEEEEEEEEDRFRSRPKGWKYLEERGIWRLWDEASETRMIVKWIGQAIATVAEHHGAAESSVYKLTSTHDFEKARRLMGKRMLKIYRLFE